MRYSVGNNGLPIPMINESRPWQPRGTSYVMKTIRLIRQGLLAVALLCCVNLSAETYEGTCGELVTWTLDTETGLLEIQSDAETNVRGKLMGLTNEK